MVSDVGLKGTGGIIYLVIPDAMTCIFLSDLDGINFAREPNSDGVD
jgi:hypothetical protein